ncbi:uroporphyrinogen-III synthase [Oceanobacillus halophilus]|uniref:Uroporphyrinogen-III synthase n=1 Tax=Oceanobacillus halophilus TaxID=930130 RepID=A0A495AEW3_9BACI|nr:uroporphyrinogen-III synthase [Oceanobacillus halophilus]RKQ37924.1 uroporphyrinogen-III synthase [Oceanobacillus halophilus]
MSAPLQRRKIIVTRDEKGAKRFSKKIAQYGGKAIEVPLLSISYDENEENKRLLQELDPYKWIFFTSANGVEGFFTLLQLYEISFSTLKNIQIAVVGHKTEMKLKKYGFSADFMPTIYNADTMADEFLSSYPDPGKVLLVRGNLSRNILPEEFVKATISYDCIQVYKTMIKRANRDRLNKALQEDYDFITFSSPSAVDAFMTLSDYPINKPCVCIGTTTEQRAKEVGFMKCLSPDSEFTIEAMIQCMIDYINNKE